MNPNSTSASSNPPGGRSMYSNYGYAAGGDYASNNTNGSGSGSNSSMSYPPNSSSSSNVGGKMGMPYGMNSPSTMNAMMNQLMNPSATMNNALPNSYSGNDSSNPGPIRGGQGKFFNRSGAPYGMINFLLFLLNFILLYNNLKHLGDMQEEEEAEEEIVVEEDEINFYEFFKVRNNFYFNSYLIYLKIFLQFLNG